MPLMHINYAPLPGKIYNKQLHIPPELLFKARVLNGFSSCLYTRQAGLILMILQYYSPATL